MSTLWEPDDELGNAVFVAVGVSSEEVDVLEGEGVSLEEEDRAE